MDQIIQVVGALLILTAYVAGQLLLLEGVWAIVTGGSLIAKLSSSHAAPSAHA